MNFDLKTKRGIKNPSSFLFFRCKYTQLIVNTKYGEREKGREKREERKEKKEERRKGTIPFSLS